MPYVPISPGNPADLRAAAERRWSAICAERPELSPAIDLQRQLLALVSDLASTLEQGRVPRLSLPPKYLAAKLARGVPAFAAEPIPLPVQVLTPVAIGLCRALASGGAAEAADHIGQAIETGSIDPGSLFSASVSRNQTAIRTGAVHRGLSADLVWLVAELAVSPYVHALQRRVLGGDHDALGAALRAWNRGYCPACGSWPAVAEVVAGRRTLRCSFCSGAWELQTYACIYCEHAGDEFVTAAPNEERKDRRVEVCRACGGYLKSMDAAELSPFPLLSISDIETTDLDVAAMEHGYARPALRDFSQRKGT